MKETMPYKFRAWDDEIKHMYYPPNNHIALFCDGTCINLQTGKALIPMFWTGYCDEQGGEIWEKNIYKYDDPEDDSKFEVVFEDCAFRKKYTHWPKYLPKPILDAHDIKHMKIVLIGNTYEGCKRKNKSGGGV